jgi:hypothetical protein
MHGVWTCVIQAGRTWCSKERRKGGQSIDLKEVRLRNDVVSWGGDLELDHRCGKVAGRRKVVQV